VVTGSGRKQGREGRWRAFAEECAVTGFLEHWNRVVALLTAGCDEAARTANRFVAPGEASRLRFARRFYSPEHAAAMAAKNPAQVREALSGFLDYAIEAAVTGHALFDDEPDEDARSYFSKLATSEYVTMVDAFGSACFEVQRYPGDEAAFDDFYERATPDEGGILYLCKSTGEAFRPDERRSAGAYIRGNILANALADDWDAHWTVQLSTKAPPSEIWALVARHEEPWFADF
jgi:hypothetical protein